MIINHYSLRTHPTSSEFGGFKVAKKKKRRRRRRMERMKSKEKKMRKMKMKKTRRKKGRPGAPELSLCRAAGLEVQVRWRMILFEAECAYELLDMRITLVFF